MTVSRSPEPVPTFKAYYPTIEEMSTEQRSFFSSLVGEIENRRYPNIDGNISYLFTYVYGLLRQWDQQGYEWVYDRLLDLAEAYHSERKFAWYCKRWSYDCLLGRQLYERFLLLSEPEDVFATDTSFSNMRCNAFHLIGKPPTGVDLLKLSGARVTSFTRKHPAAFRDLLEAAFAEDAQRNGPWLDRLLVAPAEGKGYYSTLFSGVPMCQPRVPFNYYCFYAAYDYLDVVHSVVRDAENRLRDAHALPKVGEGWVSETELLNAIRAAFPGITIIQHGMPPWLGRQHLDIWIPRWKIAVEYHGAQHFGPVEFFGGVKGFEASIERDARKQRLCESNGVELIIATAEFSHAAVIENVARSIDVRRDRTIQTP